jgi:hypothetical protein
MPAKSLYQPNICGTRSLEEEIHDLAFSAGQVIATSSRKPPMPET